MASRNLSLQLTAVSAIVLAAWFATSTRAMAQQEKILHNFGGNSKDGIAPKAGLISDAAGNLYGTTYYGGSGGCSSELAAGCGTVFELSPKAGGGWTEKLLHSFSNDGKDGFYPMAGLIFDAAGHLYGTTSYGGTGVCSATVPTGCGTVFELTPKAGGAWGERVAHSFSGGSDGETPEGGLILDSAGNLYGTTAGQAGVGGNCSWAPYVDCGTVFELTPHAGRGWTEKVLHRFSNNGTDGYSPYGNLLRDATGNLYGGTYFGGSSGDGTVFQLTPGKGGGWTEQVLYTFFFKGNSGGGPGTLVFDSAGDLFGTLPSGGASYSGAVFELTPVGGGSWSETILYNFDVYTTGDAPNTSLVFDALGNLYGTNVYGGGGTNICLVFGGGTEEASCGTVFKLMSAGGSWTQTMLHSFGDGTDGQEPYAGLIRNTAGVFYGTTAWGGAHGGGTVFEIEP